VLTLTFVRASHLAVLTLTFVRASHLAVLTLTFVRASHLAVLELRSFGPSHSPSAPPPSAISSRSSVLGTSGKSQVLFISL